MLTQFLCCFMHPLFLQYPSMGLPQRLSCFSYLGGAYVRASKIVHSGFNPFVYIDRCNLSTLESVI